MWEELYCFGDAFYASVLDVDVVALVMFRGGSKVPSIYTVGGAGAAVFGSLVYYDSHAWRC